MKILLRLLHGLEDGLLYLLVAALLGLSVYQIVLRNVFDSGLYWADPLLRVVVLWLALVGAMIASREGGHIKIDVLSHYMSGRTLSLSKIATALFSAIICFIAAYYGYLFVVEERQCPGTGHLRERDRVERGGVAPAHVLVVLLGAVLAVVDEQVHVLTDVVARGPLRQVRERRAQRGLVVGQVGQPAPVVGEAVAEGEAGYFNRTSGLPVGIHW